ncbi:MAG: YceI family protein [Psychroflexus salarius]
MRQSILKLSFLSFILATTLGFSQTQTYNANAEQSSVLVEGTSNIHDWEITVEDLESQLQLVNDQQDELSIQSIIFTVPVKSMKSGKGGMDKNTYKALDADDYKFINFKSTSIKKSAGNYIATGDLTIAGTTNQVEIPLEISKNNNQIKLSSSYKINMLDYKIEPPKALFGTITTGENVTVITNLIYNN